MDRDPALENLALLTARDQAKFVICDRADYEWTRAFVREHDLAARCSVLLSPSHEQLPAGDLADGVYTAVVTSKVLDDKDILPNHLLHYRDYIRLVFGDA